jgi:hypothetical protein
MGGGNTMLRKVGLILFVLLFLLSCGGTASKTSSDPQTEQRVIGKITGAYFTTNTGYQVRYKDYVIINIKSTGLLIMPFLMSQDDAVKANILSVTEQKTSNMGIPVISKVINDMSGRKVEITYKEVEGAKAFLRPTIPDKIVTSLKYL